MNEDIFEVELLNAQSRNYIFVRTDGSFRIVSKKSGKEWITFGSDLSYGYKVIRLFSKIYRAHRIIAETFIPNPENKPEVNHIDGNKSNNDISNLEWVTPSENNQHAYDTGLAKLSAETKAKLSAANKGKQLSAETKAKISAANKGALHPRYNKRIYIFYNKSSNIFEELTQYQLRTKYNLNSSHLRSLCSGKRKSHAGWRCLGCYI